MWDFRTLYIARRAGGSRGRRAASRRNSGTIVGFPQAITEFVVGIEASLQLEETVGARVGRAEFLAGRVRLVGQVVAAAFRQGSIYEFARPDPDCGARLVDRLWRVVGHDRVEQRLY